MRKKISISIVCLILILVIIYIGSIYHPQLKGVCGSGLFGLRLVGSIVGVVLLASALFDFKQFNKFKARCLACSAEMEEDWIICPYCGLERREDELQ